MIETQEELHVKIKLFRGLADRSRLAILELLRTGPKSVSEIVERTGLTQPNASMHLGCLRCCGLVERGTRGRFTYYSIPAKRKIARLLAAAEDLLEDVSQQVAECSNYKERSKKS